MRIILLSLSGCFLFFTAHTQSSIHLKTSQTDTFYGKVVQDPYRLLEDTGNAKVKAWMKNESDKTTAFLYAMQGRKNLDRAVKSSLQLSKMDEIETVRYWNGRFYVSKRNPGQENFSLYEIDKKGNQKLLIDPQKAHPELKSNNVMLSGFDFSNTTPELLYVLTVGGYEYDPKIILRNMITGKEIKDTLYLNQNMGITSFDPDRSDAFYFAKSPNFNKPGVDPLRWWDSCTIWHHVVGTDPALDKPIIGSDTNIIKRDIESYVSFLIRKDLPYVYATIRNKVSSEYRIYAAPKSELNGLKTPWKMITDFSDQVSRYECFGNYLYLITQKNAPNSKVIRVDLTKGTLAQAEELIPNSSKLVTDFNITKTDLIVTLSDAGSGKFMQIRHGSRKAETLALPVRGDIKITWSDPEQTDFILSVDSWVRFREYFTYQSASKKFTHSVIQQFRPSASDALTVKEVQVKSHDGVMVPMTIIYKKGLKLNGTQPVNLRGYGAYGYTDLPSFWPEHMVWYNSGGITAVAQVRGGGIYGEAWRLAGSKETKPNTWKDFIACAGYLISHKYAGKKKIIGNGGSAGGILIGRAITERPDLFGGAVIQVGALDMVRLETTPNGRGNTTEFGSVATEKGFNGLYAMSAYHHVKEGVQYPPVLFVHGVNDNRVPVWTSLKMAARLKEAAGKNADRFLLRLDYDNGHGMQQNISGIADEFTDILSFRYWVTGKKGFQAK